MLLFKKLSFAPFFIASLIYTLYLLNSILSSPEILLSLDLNALILPLSLTALILMTSFLYVVFVTLSQDLGLITVVSIIASFTPFIIFPTNLSLILGIGIFIGLMFVYFTLNNELKTYINFNPTNLLSPSIKNLATVFIIIFSIALFFITSSSIKNNGFKIPDSLINNLINLTPIPQLSKQNLKIDPKDLELIRQNPTLLEQYGIDLQTLDKLTNPNTSLESVFKDNIRKTLEDNLAPFISWIPIIASLFFFLSLKGVVSLLSIFLGVFISLVFLLIEKINLIHFIKEMREVKKLVV